MKMCRILPDPALCAASGAASGAAALLIRQGWLPGALLFCFWAVFAPRLRTGIFLLFFALSLGSGLLHEHFERQDGKEASRFCRAEIRLTDASLSGADGVRHPNTILAELQTVDGAPATGKILVWFGKNIPENPRYGIVCRTEGELQYRGAPQLAKVDGRRHYLLSPGFLDFDAYLAAQGCCGILFVRTCQVTGEDGGLFGILLKSRDSALKAALDGVQDLRVKNLVAAMFFGCRQGLDPVSRREFSQAGVVHLFAVSGMHVAMLGALLLLLLRFLPFRRRYWALCALLGLYVLSTGANPPAVRAFCMLGTWCVLRSFLLFLPGSSILLWAAAWMLCCRPAQLLDIGFLFSFLAAGALVFGSSHLAELRRDCQAGKRYFLSGRRPRPGWGEKTLAAVAGCAAAFAAGSFLSLAAFGLFLPGSIFVNLLMIPVTALLFPLILLKIGVCWIPFLNALCAWALTRLFAIFDAVTSLGGMLFEPDSLLLHRVWPLLLVYAGFFGLLGGRGRKAWIAAVCLSAAGLALALIPEKTPHAELLLISGAANEEPCAVLADPAAKFGAVVNAPSRSAVAAAHEFLARRGIAKAEIAVFTTNSRTASRALENLALTIAPARIASLMPKGALAKALRTSPAAAQIRTEEGGLQGESYTFSAGPAKIFSEKNGWRLVYCNPATNSNMEFYLANGNWERTAEFRSHGHISRTVLENSSLPEIRHWEDSN